jgi:hypothetical protein
MARTYNYKLTLTNAHTKRVSVRRYETEDLANRMGKLFVKIRDFTRYEVTEIKHRQKNESNSAE